MQTEPLKSVSTEADGNRAVPVSIRADIAHQVDPDLIVRERMPVDASISQSNRRELSRPRRTGNVLVAEQCHPFERLIFHPHIMPQHRCRRRV
ncbi:hypothetical protein [Streptomyces sp. NPDC094032]|uniref:hypothetical protein n=1 Tax=Streptomyces sp. NPDC094032 TaxID=3155308 RepID=UPI003326D9AE